MDKKIKLNFRIDDDYLIVHTLSSIGKDDFSSRKHIKDIVAFQNYAWKKSESCYNLLIGRYSVKEIVAGELRQTIKHLLGFLTDLKKSAPYRKIRKETEKYAEFCRQQWSKNYPFTSTVIKTLTGFNLNKKFDVYITYPSLRNGNNRGDGIIGFGHYEDFRNYATVYLWHEILHSYLRYSDIEHAIIELITDEELRKRLNGGTYPPFVGHKKLAPIKKKLMPRWKQYLKTGHGNIKKFIK